MGFLVQDEFFDEWDNPKDKRFNMNERSVDDITRGYTEYFQEWAEKDLKIPYWHIEITLQFFNGVLVMKLNGHTLGMPMQLAFLIIWIGAETIFGKNPRILQHRLKKNWQHFHVENMISENS